MGWPKRGSQRPDGDINEFSQSAIKAYRETSLYKALTTRASVPAYFVGYKPNKIGLRLRKDALSPLFSGMTEDGGGVIMHLALFDVDNHDQGVDIEAWWESELNDKIVPLTEAHPGIIVYRSRRGYRLISLLAEPIHLKSPADSNAWDRQYTAWCNYLKRRFQINADVLLDWTRFQAVPHQKKDRDQPALELEIIGDVNQIGFWDPVLESADFPPERKTSGYDGVNFEGECQLLALIQLAGLRCDTTEYPDVYDICCPNWTSHSPDSRGMQDYPSKTVLYTNGPIGKIECKSAGCYRSHPNRNTDYFRHFKPENVERTRPKPPIDVWDPVVRKMANERNALCDSVSLAKLLNCTNLDDPGYEGYMAALKMQKRLERKS